MQLTDGEYRTEISNLPEGFAVESITAGPLSLASPFLITHDGIADRFTRVPVRGVVITVRLKTVPR